MNHSETAPDPIRENYPAPIYPAAAPTVAPRSEREEASHLWDYLSVLLVRRFTLVAVMVTVITLTMLWTFRQTPINRASDVIQIDRENLKIFNFQNDIQVQGQQDDVLQTQ
jgi:uncharacterized protein involved in exopolysaccharide biosynthesis